MALVPEAHAEAVGAGLPAAADHETVTRLEHVERTRHRGEGHGAHEDRHRFVQTATKTHPTHKQNCFQYTHLCPYGQVLFPL